MWEDEQCKDGGRWFVKLPKTHTNKYWEDLLLSMIGEQFRTENEILGLVVSLRPQQDTISVWHRNGKDQQKIESLREDIERILNLEEGMRLEYENFAEAIEKSMQHEKKPIEGGEEADKWSRFDNSRGRGGYRGRGRGRGGEYTSENQPV